MVGIRPQTQAANQRVPEFLQQEHSPLATELTPGPMLGHAGSETISMFHWLTTRGATSVGFPDPRICAKDKTCLPTHKQSKLCNCAGALERMLAVLISRHELMHMSNMLICMKLIERCCSNLEVLSTADALSSNVRLLAWLTYKTAAVTICMCKRMHASNKDLRLNN